MKAGDVRNIKEAVSNFHEAIGIGPLALKQDPAVKVIDTPEVSRPITWATKGQPSPEVKKLYEFLKSKGF